MRCGSRWPTPGMCQSDEHLRHGDFSAPPEVLAMLTKNGTMFPAIGGHEGAGIVEAVGPEVTAVVPGDYVAASFIPSCGKCYSCITGPRLRLRPRHDDPRRPDDRRRHLPAPPG